MKRRALICFISAAILCYALPLMADEEGKCVKRQIFSPKDIESLESEDRERWQKPELVLDLLKLKKGSTVADIGCGSGYFTVRLAERVGKEGKVFAVDIQKEMLDFLEKRLKEAKIENVELILSEPLNTHLADSSVVKALLVNVVHEVEGLPKFIQDVHRAVKGGGQMIIINWRAWPMRMGPPLPVRIPEERMIEIAREAGFELAERHDVLFYQYFLIFQKKSKGDSKP